MFFRKKINRRRVIATGLASLATAAVTSPKSYAITRKEIGPKPEGEIRVIYLGGDQLHNGQQQEITLRGICEKAGWKFLYTQDARFVTPEFISDADLLIITRWNGSVGGWRPGPIYDKKRPSDGFMSDELEAAIIDNVTNRGMGFMALHCTIATDRKKFLDFMGTEYIPHGPVQTVHLHNFNQNHPITKGIEDFDLRLEENFGAKLTNPDGIVLYESTGMEDNRLDINGWCLENGKGRIVGLLCGHTYTAWRNENYKKMYWSGAHWAMKKEIPPFG